MPRHKPKRPPQQAHWGRSHVPAPQRNLVPGRPILNMGFSMRDEARHTVNNSRVWDRNNELRNRPVTFISFGMIEPLKILNPQERDVQSPTLPEGNGEVTAVQEAKEADSTASGHITTNITNSVDSISHPVTVQDEPPISNVPSHTSPSDTPNPCADIPDPNEQGDSDSSEEVILFRGRGRKEGSGKKPLRSKSKGKSQKRRPQPLEAEEQSEWSDRAEDVMTDYIANIADSDKEDLVSLLLANPAFIRRDLGGDFEQEPDSDDMDVEMDNDMTADERQADQEDDDDSDEVAADVDDKDMARLYAKQGGFGFGDNDWAHFDYQLDGIQKQSNNSRTSPDRLSQALEGMDIGSNNPVFQKKKRKGKAKRDIEFNVDDSELEERLRRAWDNDRARKREKKAQREALRTQGLLGKNNSYDPLDLRTKYPLGISSIEIREELKAFISGHGQRLVFPPVDRGGRRNIHIMAHRLGLPSKSEGSGDTRHNVVHRTTRSMKNVILEFDTLISLKGRRYFHRSDVGGNAASKADTTKIPTGGHGGLRYRDGEVVSASVPQLGEGNKGRTMLERMGWSKGMALGAEHNKGILEPVAQVVKTTKAGLGT